MFMMSRSNVKTLDLTLRDWLENCFDKDDKHLEQTNVFIKTIKYSISLGFYVSQMLYYTQHHSSHSGILKNIKEMQSIQELASLVFACTVAMVILHVLCYLMERIRNIAVNAMEWERRLENQMQQEAEPAMQRRPVAVEHEWIG